MKTLICLIAITLLSGCASMMNDRMQTVRITSDTAGDTFQVSNQDDRVIASGRTPAQLELSAAAGYFDGERYTVRFGRAGAVVIDSTVSGWYWAGLLGLEPVIGPLIIDPLSGAMFKLPEAVHGHE